MLLHLCMTLLFTNMQPFVLNMPENINDSVVNMTSRYNHLPMQKERYEHELQKVRSSSARSQAKSALTVFELKDENTKLLEENTKLLSEKAPDHEGTIVASIVMHQWFTAQKFT